MAKSLVKAAGAAAKVIFENDKVRVVELNWKKGVKLDMHAHPSYLAYGITAMKFKSKSPEGKAQNRSIKKGEIIWYEAESHAVENTGPSARGLVFEFK